MPIWIVQQPACSGGGDESLKEGGADALAVVVRVESTLSSRDTVVGAVVRPMTAKPTRGDTAFVGSPRDGPVPRGSIGRRWTSGLAAWMMALCSPPPSGSVGRSLEAYAKCRQQIKNENTERRRLDRSRRRVRQAFLRRSATHADLAGAMSVLLATQRPACPRPAKLPLLIGALVDHPYPNRLELPVCLDLAEPHGVASLGLL